MSLHPIRNTMLSPEGFRTAPAKPEKKSKKKRSAEEIERLWLLHATECLVILKDSRTLSLEMKERILVDLGYL